MHGTDTTREHTRKMFAWLNQVKRDPGLPASAFKVAFEIQQHVTAGGLTAWPGSDTIAKNIAMSKGTVISRVKELEARGHLAITPGRRGSGHSNRYRLIFKKGQSFDRKGQPVDMNNSRAGEAARPLEIVNRVSRREQFQRLLDCYPPGLIGDETEAFAAFELALDADYSCEEIIKEVQSITWSEEDMPLGEWLRQYQDTPF